MSIRHPNWTRILTILLVILASLALLYVAISILGRFRQAILLFVLGALLAYVMSPLVNRLAAAFRVRFLAILLAYGMVAAGLFALGVLLFTPFIQQSQSLVNNLRAPSRASLRTISDLQANAFAVQTVLDNQVKRVRNSHKPRSKSLLHLQSHINSIGREVAYLRRYGTEGVTQARHEKKSGSPIGARAPPNPPAKTAVPASYVAFVSPSAQSLLAEYPQLAAQARRRHVSTTLLEHASADAATLRHGADKLHAEMASTPVLLIRAQGFLDSHGVHIDLHNKFGEAANQAGAQGSALLNNAITILSETANILLNLTLVLIISVYMLSDGAAMVRRGVALVPDNGREQAWFFVTSLDKVLGGYIRGQILLSLLAGILGGGGAAVLGVPYPLLIGLTTALLQAIPVIGPMVAVVPAVAISVFFTPFVTTVLLLIWFIVFQQLVTNVLGPRVMGAAVGIHPLEALLAVLIGFPLGGFLGAFLAVPLMGVVHILVREAYSYFVLKRSLPAAPVPADIEEEAEESGSTPVPREARRAAGG